MKPPPGWTAAWSAIGASFLALIVYQALHHHGAPSIQLGPQPTVTITASAARSATPPARPSSRPPAAPVGGLLPIAASTRPTGRPSTPSSPTHSSSPSASARPSPTTSPSGPAPSAPPPVLAVTLAAALPARTTPLVAARAAVAIPAGPPFPTLTARLTLLGLHAAIALP